MSCDTNEQSPLTAAIGGLANGITGLIGLGSFWDPVDDSGLTNVSNDLTSTSEKFQAKLKEDKDTLTKIEKQFWNSQLQYITASNKFHQELENDSIQQNKLLIQIIIGILLIIIIYLVVL